MNRRQFKVLGRQSSLHSPNPPVLFSAPSSQTSNAVTMPSPQTQSHCEVWVTKPERVSRKFDAVVCRSAWKTATS